ncbi:MAG: hypothetical protein GY819_10120 [Planctomycetaceae bacterium]|nr:hypothetical protein [Planctomycetaceae bacterium]MCP4463137.1 hypothetical protein [Planctomycetaceae bacterium]MDG1809528.1 hypothetical protein [Pirellulaceae bacterium]MDG2103090.1 hypothetical protein [Pirellulaceae bacterium]
MEKTHSVAERWLYGTGILLVLSGIFHLFVWMVLGGGWEGSISWRKPILFGISTGLTALSLGWIYSKMEVRKWDRVVCGVFCVAILAEVGLISLQQWRGVPSHFNQTTNWDRLVDQSMTVLISIAAVVLLDFTIRSFKPLHTTSDMRLAIRAGMAFLIISCVIGYVIALHGHHQVQLGEDPAIIGKAGVAKFPHGLAIHAIQLFPVLCFLWRKLRIPLATRRQNMICCVTAMGIFLVFSLLQTFRGRPRFDLDILSWGSLSAMTLCLLPVGWTASLAIYRLLRQFAKQVRGGNNPEYG